jgi:hypothetical protein
MRRYIDGMNEIKADEALKQKIMLRVKESNRNPSAYIINFKKAAMFFAFASIFILVTMFGISYYQNSSRASKGVQAQSEFHGIYLTAFSAAGTPFLVKPNDSLGQYSMLMSSVPGFPLKIDCLDADTIHLQATNGSFLIWTRPDFKVVDKGKSVDIHSGDTIYWSPVSMSDVTKSTIEITTSKKGKELGRNTIEIMRDGGFTYTGKLLE